MILNLLRQCNRVTVRQAFIEDKEASRPQFFHKKLRSLLKHHHNSIPQRMIFSLDARFRSDQLEIFPNQEPIRTRLRLTQRRIEKVCLTWTARTPLQLALTQCSAASCLLLRRFVRSLKHGDDSIFPETCCLVT